MYVRFGYFGGEHEGCFILGYYAVWFVSLLLIFGGICCLHLCRAEGRESTMKREAVGFFKNGTYIPIFTASHFGKKKIFVCCSEYSLVTFRS